MLRKALLILATSTAFGITGLARAADAAAPWQGSEPEVETLTPDDLGNPGLDHITVFHIDGWRAVGRDAIILWTTPFEPYLLKLDRPAFDLPFVENVGVTSTGHELYARFDSVIVRGMPYRIASIHAISREAARTMRSADKVG